MKIIPLSWTEFFDINYLFAANAENIITVVVSGQKCYSNNNSNEVLQSSIVRNCQFTCSNSELKKPMKLDNTSSIVQLLKVSEIRPYAEIELKSYQFDEVTGFYHVRSEDIVRTDEDVAIKAKVITMYFDIEVISYGRSQTLTRSFPDANSSDSEIRIITVVLTDGKNHEKYVLATTNNNLEAFREKYPDVKLAISKNQHDLLMNFYYLWSYASPTYVIHYNGYSFDTPFMVRKTQLENVSLANMTIGRLANPTQRLVVATREYLNNIGKSEMTYTWITPGVTEIDLLPYFRRFYPNIANYRLDTVAKLFLGEGKTGLGIDEMMSIIEADSDAMSTVIEYAYVDTLRLFELDQKLEVVSHLKRVANSAMLTIEQLLTMKDYKLLQSVVYNIDHAPLCRRMIFDKIDFVLTRATGILLDVYVYNYRPAILEALRLSEDCKLMQLAHVPKNMRFVPYRRKQLTVPETFCNQLHEHIRELPIQLIIRLIYSNYGPVDARNAIYTIMLDLMEDKENILAIDEASIVTRDPLDLKADPRYTLIDREDARVFFTDTNYAVYDGRTISYHGFSAITNPAFPIIRQITDNYITQAVANIRSYLANELTYDQLARKMYDLTQDRDLTTIPIADLASKVRIRPSSYYQNKNESIQKRISTMYSVREDADFLWKYATYFLTEGGLRVVDFDGYPTHSQLNTAHYTTAITRVLTTLREVTDKTLLRLK